MKTNSKIIILLTVLCVLVLFTKPAYAYIDPACTEFLYQRMSRESGLKGILPLTMDLANPSPGLGWDNHERISLRDRAPADLILALATYSSSCSFLLCASFAYS